MKEIYFRIIDEAKGVFLKKLEQYGTSWKYFRPVGLADQIFIKASRIRKIEETGTREIEENIEAELLGIINYAVVGLILSEIKFDVKVPLANVPELYDKYVKEAFELMQKKNTDYDDAWKRMSVQSYTDIILVRCERLKNICEKTPDDYQRIKDQFTDILNYSVFYQIRLRET